MWVSHSWKVLSVYLAPWNIPYHNWDYITKTCCFPNLEASQTIKSPEHVSVTLVKGSVLGQLTSSFHNIIDIIVPKTCCFPNLEAPKTNNFTWTCECHTRERSCPVPASWRRPGSPCRVTWQSSSLCCRTRSPKGLSDSWEGSRTRTGWGQSPTSSRTSWGGRTCSWQASGEGRLLPKWSKTWIVKS